MIEKPPPNGLDPSTPAPRPHTEEHLCDKNKLQHLFESMGEAYFETDLTGRLTFFNDIVCNLIGRSAEELKQLDYRTVMSSEDAARTYCIFNRVYKTGNPSNAFEFDIIRKDGSRVTVQTVVSLLRNPENRAVGFYGLSRDTIKRQVANALEECEENLNHILACAPYSISILRGSDWRYVHVNEAFSRRTGYAYEEVIGRTALELNLYLNTMDRSRLRNAMLTQSNIGGIELQFQNRAGEHLETMVFGRRIRFRGEDCFLIISTEITALKKTQRAYAESEEKYRTILENMNEGYYETDLSGTFTFVNNAMGKVLGYPPKELLGLNSRTNIFPDDLERILKSYQEVYKTGTPATVLDYTVIRKDGSLGVIETSASLLKDANGKPIGFYGISRDITERKQAELELTRYKMQLEERVRERTVELERAQEELVKREKLSVLGQLTATVSHELRNPLGVIRSSNFFLQRKVKEIDPKVDKHFRRIEAQVALCDAIVGDLLEYTRGRNVAVATEDINQWLAQLLNQQQEKEGVIIHHDLAQTLPAVPHDREKMRRVVINIMDNAIQAVQARQEKDPDPNTSYRPEIWVTTTADDRHVRITIEDNGIGMDPQTRQRAFEPLFTTRARGTGIGLAIVHKIVSEHGGHIGLESRPQAGTKVVIHLPFTRSLQ